MRVLITGVYGGIGKALFKSLMQSPKYNNAHIYGCSRKVERANFGNFHTLPVDLTKPADVIGCMQTAKPTHIIHLAGQATNTPTKGVIESNIVATTNLVDYAPRGTRFIFASSSTVYGNTPFGISYERDNTNPSTLYGCSKVFGENIVDIATRQDKLRGVSLRLCAVVGKGMTHGLLKTVLAEAYRGKVTLFGEPPGVIKPYIHVDDAIAAIKFFLSKDFLSNDAVGIYNVSVDDEMSTDQVFYTVLEETGCLVEKVWTGENLAGDNPFVSLDNHKLKSVGWTLKYPTSGEAIRAAIREIREDAVIDDCW